METIATWFSIVCTAAILADALENATANNANSKEEN